MDGMPDDTHVCPGGCGGRVTRRLYACKPCWARLPHELKMDVRQTYRGSRRSGTGRWAGDARAARAWYRNNPPQGGTT